MAKKTCLTCRSRKIRCDGTEPICNRCIKSNRECIFSTKRTGPIAFRHSKLSALVAAVEQTDPRSPSNVGSEELPSGNGFRLASPLSVAEVILKSSVPSVNANSPSSQQNTICSISSPTTSLTTATQGYDFSDNTQSEDPSLELQAATPYSPSRPIFDNQGASNCTYDQQVPRPLNSIEGELLHFYVQNIGPWLDVTSPERHYTYTVPRLGLHCQLLHTAIMACSAHVMRLLDQSRTNLTAVEEQYQSECVGLLIPILDDVRLAVQDDAVLATIVILRMSEQYDEYHVDRQCHLVPGAFSHLGHSVTASTAAGGLLQATFYSYVRADIRMAILGQCRTKLSVDSWPLDESSPSNDADWANRITWLLVHVINLCYGNEDGMQGIQSYEQLYMLIDDWKAHIPSTFEPYFYEDRENTAFPIIRLLCPWHVVGLQFYHTSKILLATHYPLQGAFNDALSFNKFIKIAILPHVRNLCALSFSNEHYGCRINSSHCLATGSRFFTGREEQDRILDYFDMLQHKQAWPSRACKEMLNEAWAI
ncbi:hypothetical protein N7510_006736 [Penicillium lagena]|uniref:uncharacterized protein n=1 Tax=Penicillium lagena TaxID=94218 RepID=UPI00253F761E|nr:uncharacterized protein N7510_006736 [Penicillium lagena]KAJ5610017.1 hypothetical protein N7510_006736 [Penicillium lagena]